MVRQGPGPAELLAQRLGKPRPGKCLGHCLEELCPGGSLGQEPGGSLDMGIIRVKQRFDVNAQTICDQIQVGLMHLTASVAELTQWNSLSVCVAATQTQ